MTVMKVIVIGSTSMLIESGLKTLTSVTKVSTGEDVG